MEKRYWRKSENFITYIRKGGTLTEVRLVIFAFCFHGCYQFVSRSSHGRRICKLPAWWCTCPGIWLMPEKTTTFVDPNFQPYPISLLLRDRQANGNWKKARVRVNFNLNKEYLNFTQLNIVSRCFPVCTAVLYDYQIRDIEVILNPNWLFAPRLFSA